MSRNEKFVEKLFSMKGVRFIPQKDEDILKVSMYDQAWLLTINIKNHTIEITKTDNEEPGVESIEQEIMNNKDDFILMAKAYIRGFNQCALLFLF